MHGDSEYHLGYEIEFRETAQLSSYPNNARTHSKKQIHQIATSIRSFGFTNPILIDADDQILAGHGRVEAAKLLGMSKVPVIRFDHLSPEQKKAYVIADNKIAANAGWNPDLLKIELQGLLAANEDVLIEVTGFETAEIDLIIDGDGKPNPSDPADRLPPEHETVVSIPSDLWILGNHKLFCGDACDPGSYAQLLGSKRARAVFTDPPYNVPIDGHVCGLGSIKHREFKMASGEMSSAAFTDFLRRSFEGMARYSVDGALHYVCMDWRHIEELYGAARDVYSGLKALCVWNKDNGGMGSLYRSKHELIFVWKVGDAPHINTIELGKHGRYRTNVWNYPGANTFRRGRLDDLAMHPTVKPVALVVDAIKDATRRGDIVLDPFSGSGTTIIAAEKCGRHARAIELDPEYVDAAVSRWEQFTGRQAVEELTGETFAQVKAWRLKKQSAA